MANTFYPLGMVKFANGDIDWDSDTIRIAALSSGYVYSDAHEFLSDVGANTLGTVMDMPGRAILGDGVLDASLTSYAGVTVGQTVVGWVIYKHVTAAADSPLLMYVDTNDDGTPISRAGDGTNIAVLWSTTADRVARI